MSDDCPYSAEKIIEPTSAFCLSGSCQWHFDGRTTLCPHPEACNRQEQCLHPVPA